MKLNKFIGSRQKNVRLSISLMNIGVIGVLVLLFLALGIYRERSEVSRVSGDEMSVLLYLVLMGYTQLQSGNASAAIQQMSAMLPFTDFFQTQLMQETVAQVLFEQNSNKNFKIN